MMIYHNFPSKKLPQFGSNHLMFTSHFKPLQGNSMQQLQQPLAAKEFAVANIRDNKLQRTVRSIAGDLLDMSQLGSFNRMLGGIKGEPEGASDDPILWWV